jgi:glycosyltransferase involved in cell wall biosynthesis
MARARNRGLAEATGEIIVFTDDDVRVPETWIEGMCQPIGQGEADAVAGGVVLAPHILQPWMETAHRTWLASTEWFTEENFMMVGANMSFGTRVLGVVGQFDVELGPGALGTLEDHLFCQRIRRAGFKVVAKPLVAVMHFPDPRRLTARAYRDLAREAGRSDAYIAWHFRGVTINWPHLRFASAVLRLWSHRVRNLSELLRHPTIPAWEFQLCRLVAHRKQYLKERRRERKYFAQ